MLSSLLPNPLHPAVVHLPMALTLLLPLFVFGSLWAIRRGSAPRVAWGVTAALFAALALSAWVAVETGEDTAEQVERVVTEETVETHEERAEAFQLMSAVMLGVALVGFAPGRAGQAARLTSAVGSVVLLGAGWQVGHSGGALVYQHGAASAYATPGGSAEKAPATRTGSGGDDDR